MTDQPSHPWEVSLPLDLRARAARAVADDRLQRFVGQATRLKDRARRESCAAAFGSDYGALRELAGRIRQHALDHLDFYLERFVERAEAAGAQVHFAADARDACAVCTRIARSAGAALCVKSKSMVTEEIGLVAAFEREGIETIETDLGEFILQLDHDAPSHIVTPMIHKDRAAVGRAFARALGTDYTDDPRALTGIARRHLRERFARAHLGVSGANFLIAESGSVVICTNEGNGRFCAGLPPVHLVVAGLEKLVPRLVDLTVLLKLLARSSTGQPLTCYTQLITGPRRAADPDGPRALHVVLLDNGRTRLLRGAARELLRCIRCGACLNACPVYRVIGGHSYGSVYPGPIGAAITPLLRGLRNFADLPRASSLCGACFEACPVAIDLPRHLIRLRSESVRRRIGGRVERAFYRLWALVLRHPPVYRLAVRLLRIALRSAAGRESAAGHDDPFQARRWATRLPPPLSGWTDHRDMPAPTTLSFREWWRRRPPRGRDAPRAVDPLTRRESTESGP